MPLLVRGKSASGSWAPALLDSDVQTYCFDMASRSPCSKREIAWEVVWRRATTWAIQSICESSVRHDDLLTTPTDI